MDSADVFVNERKKRGEERGRGRREKGKGGGTARKKGGIEGRELSSVDETAGGDGLGTQKEPYIHRKYANCYCALFFVLVFLLVFISDV